MKVIATILICFFSAVSSYGSEAAFYKFALEVNGVFIPVDIISPEYSGKALVENSRLRRYLAESRSVDEKEYVPFVTDVLLKKKNLAIENDDLKKWNFIKIQTVDSVDEWFAKGEKEFVAHYFSKNFLVKKPMDVDERNAIIAKLFEWQIAAVRDDVSGYIRIVKFDEKEQPRAVSPACIIVGR